MIPELHSYDHVILAFSGGKDSLACALYLLELGVPRERIELWHHDVDGREGSALMDWPITRDYCRKVAQALDLPIFFSWKVGGFEGEMLRENCKTTPVRFEVPEGEVKQVGGKRGKASTRLMFPQVSADLSVRWCSAYLKIDVCTAAINNQARFVGKRTLVITGERAEESPNRARYSEFEPHKADNRDGVRVQRHVDQWRPVHGWDEARVWLIIERHRVNPHPAYRLGWGRVSCAACIFGSPNQWASLLEIDPEKVNRIAAYEARFDKTINRKFSVLELAAKGEAYDTMTPHDTRAALSETFDEPVIVDHWRLPAGAYGESCGPM